jgi:glycosyltransferase involved in cell wall biosynthesis
MKTKQINKKLTILFLSAASNVHTVRWVNSLVNEGHVVHLVYLPNHSPSKHKIDKRVNLHVLNIGGQLGYYANYHSLKKIYKTIRPDIVNAHYASGYGTLAHLANVKPLVLSAWGSDIYSFPNKSLLHSRLIQSNILFADKVTSSSLCMAEEIKKVVPRLNSDKLSVIPFGIDLKTFHPKRFIRPNNRHIVIGTIKTLKVNYRIDTLIDAIAILVNEVTPLLRSVLQVEIYGDGPQKDKLQRMINDLGLKKIIHLRGAIPNTEVPKKLNAMDIFCVTSNHESFGVAVLEAMAMQLPVVATNVDGFREVMRGEPKGFLVPINDPVMVANKLSILIANKSLRESMGGAGRANVKKLYNWRKNVASMIELYHEVINTKNILTRDHD